MGYGSSGRGSNRKTFDEDFMGTNNSSSYTAVDANSKKSDFLERSDKSAEMPSRRTKSNQEFVEGIVTGYEIGVDDSGTLRAWFRSLLHGVPFSSNSEEHIFQLVLDEFDANSSCIEIHLFGRIDTGKINNGEKVKVYGSRVSSGAYLANKIVKVNNNIKVTLKHTTPAFVVRAITLVLLAIVVALIMGLVGANMGRGISSIFSSLANADFWKKVLAGVVVLIALLFGGKIRRFTGLPLKYLWIVVGILILFLIPETMTILAWIIIILVAFRLLKEIVRI